ncbi:Asp23/Gls24 family envelope stress response protein [Actinopolyspora erythraea]|uniref:Asp23/Gls24 family envelope stress response protein n=1 Tax=Actinopolyspora erythraea TaxID=414996 RepID=A0A099DBF7_9ACTN|nr:Asp23/Gls24 family envelope stress response protein [Actinopolyspora erythraea]ASU80581.1 Asp23/Gls24 family envelope stress response protein [Actinopolyspora erythraea]KGI82740.1 hypothetical protein IL38_02340 [Actinopolyspora erythraea]
MSTHTGEQKSQQSQDTTSGTAPRSPAVSDGTQLDSTQGRTTVADVVVSKIAGLAAHDVSGVHGFGGGASRAWGAMRERIPGARSSTSQGVTVEVGEKQAAIDVVIVVEYGVSIVELARGIRRNVISAVEQMTGLEVVEVNIDVTDLHLPDEDGNHSSQPTRVE